MSLFYEKLRKKIRIKKNLVKRYIPIRMKLLPNDCLFFPHDAVK